MAQEFDPYHRWLGIPPAEQPVNHYRLLGIPLFESDPEVIRDGAAQRMAHVRTYQLGPNSALSQKILNELGSAKACLLDPTAKAAYDETLQAQSRPFRSRSPRKLWTLLALPAVAVAIVLAILFWFHGNAGDVPSAHKAPAGPAAEVPSAVPPVSPEPPALAVVPFDAEKAREHQVVWAKHLGVPVEMANSLGMKFVLIPPGEFEMGSTQEDVDQRLKEAKQKNDPEWYRETIPREAPRHRARLTKPFYLGTCEVAVGAFRRFVDQTGYRTDAEKDGKGGFSLVAKKGWAQKAEFVWHHPSFAQTDAHPVIQVSWNDAAAFCQWLGRSDGNAYRLPTDAEWEYACRAGSAWRFSFGDDEKLLGEYAWHLGNAGGNTHPVGEKKANAFGLHDMEGNVREWCEDWFAPDYYAKAPLSDPAGPESGAWRVTRGNVWNDISAIFRCTCRTGNALTHRDANIGFRVACTIPLKAAPP